MGAPHDYPNYNNLYVYTRNLWLITSRNNVYIGQSLNAHSTRGRKVRPHLLHGLSKDIHPARLGRHIRQRMLQGKEGPGGSGKSPHHTMRVESELYAVVLFKAIRGGLVLVGGPLPRISAR